MTLVNVYSSLPELDQSISFVGVHQLQRILKSLLWDDEVAPFRTRDNRDEGRHPSEGSCRGVGLPSKHELYNDLAIHTDSGFFLTRWLSTSPVCLEASLAVYCP